MHLRQYIPQAPTRLAIVAILYIAGFLWLYSQITDKKPILDTIPRAQSSVLR